MEPLTGVFPFDDSGGGDVKYSENAEKPRNFNHLSKRKCKLPSYNHFVISRNKSSIFIFTVLIILSVSIKI